jgi:hypothetical protein
MIDLKADWGGAKMAINPERVKEAYKIGMLKAAGVLALAAREAAPEFAGPEPKFGYTHGSEPGTMKDSIVPIFTGPMTLIVARAHSAEYVMKGHQVLSTPGQLRWFHANYPWGYKRISPGGAGDPVPPNDFTLEVGAVDIPFLVSIVKGELEKVK